MANDLSGHVETGGGGILPRVARREPGAMKECIDQFGRLVWGITRRYVPAQTEAEDLVQEVFTELWKKADRYERTKASEVTFIALIARRRSIDWVRRKNRMPDLAPMSEATEVAAPAPAGSRFDAEQVRAALAELPEPTRRVFALHFDEGLTHPEISDRIGMPLGTVKTRLRRGLIEIRERISRAVENPNHYSVS